jgi:hypothetical protein
LLADFPFRAKPRAPEADDVFKVPIQQFVLQILINRDRIGLEPAAEPNRWSLALRLGDGGLFFDFGNLGRLGRCRRFDGLRRQGDTGSRRNDAIGGEIFGERSAAAENDQRCQRK